MINIVLVLLLLLAPSTHAEVIDRIAAVVGSDVITLSELNEAIAARSRASEGKEEHHPTEVVHSEVLDELINDRLFERALKGAKIEVTDDDLARAISNILKQNHLALEKLKAELASKGMSYEQYKQQVEREIRRVKFINQVIGPQVKISDQDLHDYYQRHLDRFRATREAHLSENVFPLAGITKQEEFRKLEEKALEISARGRRDPASFVGQDLGMQPLKDMPPEVAQAVGQLDIGEVSRPILTSAAVVIIKLIALPEIAATDFERLRDDIYGALYNERVEEELKHYLSQERRKAHVDIR